MWAIFMGTDTALALEMLCFWICYTDTEREGETWRIFCCISGDSSSIESISSMGSSYVSLSLSTMYTQIIFVLDACVNHRFQDGSTNQRRKERMPNQFVLLVFHNERLQRRHDRLHLRLSGKSRSNGRLELWTRAVQLYVLFHWMVHEHTLILHHLLYSSSLLAKYTRCDLDSTVMTSFSWILREDIYP